MDRFLLQSKRAMVWLALAMALACAAARAQTFLTAPVNLSGTGHAVMPSIAVGPAGDINVVWLDSTAILFRRSLDGGMTFSPTMTVATTNLPSPASQPQIAVNSAGVYVAWAGPRDIFLSTLANGTWSAPINVSQGKGIGSSAPVPHIAVDPGGGVDIVWGQTAAYFARSTNGGSSFSTLTRLSASPMASVSPRLAIGAQGTVYVVWENAGTCPAIWFARSTDNGLNFAPYPVDDTLTVNSGTETGCTYDVQIALGANNTIHLLWANDHSNISSIKDLITTYQTDSGGPFLGFDAVNHQGFQNLSGPSSFTPQIAIDASGNINVVWMGEVSQSDARLLVYFTRSTDGGRSGTFCGGPNDPACTNPPILSSPLPSGAKATAVPQIATEPSGAIDIVWQQASAANPANAYDIVLARSTDGLNFTKTTLNNAPTTQGGTGQIAADKSGNVYAVWQGSSASGSDVLLNGDSAGILTPPPFSLSGVKVSVSPLSAVINVNGAASFGLSVSSTNSVPGSLTFSCGGAPAGVSCSFNPTPLSISANGTATATWNVSVSVKPSASVAQRTPGAGFGQWPGGLPPMAAWAWGIGFVMLVATWMAARRAPSRFARIARAAALALLLATVATSMLSCGGSTNGGGGGGGGGSITFPLTLQAHSNSETANLQAISITVP